MGRAASVASNSHNLLLRADRSAAPQGTVPLSDASQKGVERGISGDSIRNPKLRRKEYETTRFICSDGMYARAVTSETLVFTLKQPVQAGFYTGSIPYTGNAEAGDVTLVQEGAEVRFTISSSGKTTAWGGGLAGKNKMELQWRDDAGVTGIGKAVKQ